MQDKEKDLEYYKKDFEEYKKSLKGEMTKEEEQEAKKNAEEFLQSLLQAHFRDIGADPLDEKQAQEIKTSIEKDEQEEADILSKDIKKALDQFKDKVNKVIASVDEGMNEAYKKLGGAKDEGIDINISCKLSSTKSLNTTIITSAKGGYIYFMRSAVDDLIQSATRVEARALKTNKQALDEAQGYIEKLISNRSYKIFNNFKELEALIEDEERKSALIRVYTGTPTRAIAKFNSKNAIVDDISKSAVMENEEAKLTIMEFKSLKGSFNINTNKILMAGIHHFTVNNDNESAKKGIINYEVAIPIKDYCISCGYTQIIEEEKETPEEQEKERQRALKALWNIRGKLDEDLDILSHSRLEWYERDDRLRKIMGGNVIRTALIGSNFLGKDYMHFFIDPFYAKYLVNSPQTLYPKLMFSIDAKNANSFLLQLKLSEHYNMASNIKRGTNNRISVKALLKATNIITYEQVKKQRKSWEERIKEPLENSLGLLRKKGTLKDWEYCKAKGVRLTDEEANFTDYHTWEKAFIKFELTY